VKFSFVVVSGELSRVLRSPFFVIGEDIQKFSSSTQDEVAKGLAAKQQLGRIANMF